MTMFNRKRKLNETISNRTRSHRLALGAVLGLSLMCSVVLATDSLRPARSYSLSSRIKAISAEDGTLEIISSDLAQPLVVGQLDALADSRRRRGGETALQSFVSLSREGMPGGQRGFSAQADDDADGLVDEDRLDGRDNDGDGLIDEDYAAISDAMTAVHLSQGLGWAQLEFMQWAGTRLQNALFLNFSASHELSSVTTPYYRLQSSGEPWQEIDVFSRRHNLAGQSLTNQATAFVLRVENPVSVANLAVPSALSIDSQSVFTWVGVLVLDQSVANQDRRYLRPQLEGSLLSLPLTHEPTPVVICTASSWMQLNRLLLDAVTVYQGVQDPVSQLRARWIVSPLCSICRLEKAVEVVAQSGSSGGLSLEVTLQSGRSGLMDPDLLVLEGISLGAPSKITWKPTDGPVVETPWSVVSFDANLQIPADLYGFLGEIPNHDASGVLIFGFENPPAEVSGLLQTKSEVELAGVWLDGRTFVTRSSVNLLGSRAAGLPVGQAENPAESESSRAYQDRLSLAPDLLEGWPNPFRDQIRIEFVVPSSTRELFDWPEDEPIPEGIELSAPVVWSGGQPSVSVKIYSINGQELVSLQQGHFGEGRYSVSWNGTDAYGRQVASGTYFCKLQLDDWSLTRRLVFIR